jgi:hypothetical protein
MLPFGVKAPVLNIPITFMPNYPLIDAKKNYGMYQIFQ